MKPRIEALESRLPLAATLVADFNTVPQSGFPDQLTVFQEAVYFFTKGTFRPQLWKTDGSEDGTKLVAELDGGSPITGQPLVYNSLMYFVLGSVLWQSDGTIAGTQPIQPLGQFPSNDLSWATLGNDIYLWDPQLQTLWVTHGSLAETVQVFASDPSVSNNYRYESTLLSLGDEVFFTVYDGFQSEIWKSDGTSAGTVPVRKSQGEVRFGGVIDGAIIFSDGGNIGKLDDSGIELLHTGIYTHIISQVLNGWVYFASTSEEYGKELYRTRGQAMDIELLDLVPGPMGSVPQNLHPLGAGFIFDGMNSDGQETLWYSDGILAGSQEIYHGERVRSGEFAPRIIGDHYHFFVETAESDTQAWRTDGTSSGTEPLAADSLLRLPTRAQQAVQFQDRTILTLRADEVGEEIWVYDGTQTTLLADTRPGTRDSDPTVHYVEGNLWITRKDQPGITSLTPDGLLHPIDSDSQGIHVITSRDGSQTYVVIYSNDTSMLYRSDGESLTPLGPHGGVEFIPWGDSGIAFLTGLSSGRSSEVQLWVSDGTPAGTRVLADVSQMSLRPIALAAVEETVFFINNFELWKVDEDGHAQSISPLYGEPNKFTGLSSTQHGALVFGRGPLGQERRSFPIWSSDDTTDGTTLLLEAERPVRVPLFSHHGVAYFSAVVGGRSGLWRTDGTHAGTFLIAHVEVFQNGNEPLVAAIDDDLYFVASSDAFDYELWRTDGTVEGTHQVSDLTPGPDGTAFGNLSASQGKLFFTAWHRGGDFGIWTSDGSSEGTYRMAANLPQDPQHLWALGDKLYFAATDELAGRELFSIPIPEEPLVGDVDTNGRVDFDDFLILSANFGKHAATTTDGDLNRDTVVDFADFLLLSANFEMEAKLTAATDAVFRATTNLASGSRDI